jgi:hypothetical protein
MGGIDGRIEEYRSALVQKWGTMGYICSTYLVSSGRGPYLT